MSDSLYEEHAQNSILGDVCALLIEALTEHLYLLVVFNVITCGLSIHDDHCDLID